MTPPHNTFGRLVKEGHFPQFQEMECYEGTKKKISFGGEALLGIIVILAVLLCIAGAANILYFFYAIFPRNINNAKETLKIAAYNSTTVGADARFLAKTELFQISFPRYFEKPNGRGMELERNFTNVSAEILGLGKRGEMSATLKGEAVRCFLPPLPPSSASNKINKAGIEPPDAEKALQAAPAPALIQEMPECRKENMVVA
jgi:hypothetical protein